MRIKLLTRGTPYTTSYHFASLALHKFLLQNNILINIFGPGGSWPKNSELLSTQLGLEAQKNHIRPALINLLPNPLLIGANRGGSHLNLTPLPSLNFHGA